MEGREQNDLIFAVNGEKFELSSVDPSMTLLQFLRSKTRFKSVKLGCGEGGCGACVVLLSKYDPVLDKVESFNISSCLTLVCSINHCSVTTSEGLGSTKVGFHPVHKRISGFHGSQCGFCTPGMCMSFFAALVNADKSKLTASEAEKSVSGNLCRCTGYRPIVDACKSFAKDVDIEDLGFNSFWRKGEETKENILKSLPSYNHDDQFCEFPEFLKRKFKSTLVLNSEKYRWCSPRSILELQTLLEANNAIDGVSVKLVVGNTGTGYYKEQENHDKYIDISHIPELSEIKKFQTRIEIGAAVSISKVIDALKEESNAQSSFGFALLLKKISTHMEKIANRFIRNSGSIGGNLVMAQSKKFPSDIATVLLAVGTMVNLLDGNRHVKITIDEFLEGPPLCESKNVLLSIEIPFCKTSSETNGGLLFETYRSAPRPLGSALPYLNAAFLVEVSRTSDGNVVNNSRLAFGSYGTPHAIRVLKVEEFLIGKLVSEKILYKAFELLRDTIVPGEGSSYPFYRTSLAVGFLFEFFGPLIEVLDEIPNVRLSRNTGFSSSLNNGHIDETKSQTLLSSSQQVFENKEFHPVGEAVVKSGALIQASGEAVFVDDIASPVNCLYGAFIYSSKPLARIKNIGFRENVQPTGVSALISFKDIPKNGLNVGSKTIFGTEPLFADEITQCAGQRIALVVADTQKNADMAANAAVIDYNTENLGKPILSVEEAVERSSLYEVPPTVNPKPVGDILKGMAEADCKILSAEIRLGSQYYFYMEPQTALAVPDEDNCMVVYSSSQCPEYVHWTVAKCLGVREHNVRVITRRVGGGFGGKAIKSMPVATVCALAAHKLQRPVRMYLNRKTDMIMAGGRHPMKITYSVGFKTDGKITALELEILIDAGISVDISPMIPHNIVGTLSKYDWGALSFNVKVCKTNLPSRSAMRAPGEVQGSYIAEAVIENVASSLAMDPDAVRKINLHTHDSISVFYKASAGEPLEYTLPLIWDKVSESSGFEQRVKMMKKFNSGNIWRKRGISRIPIIHQVMQRPTPGKVSILSDGSVVVEVGGNEIGQGLYTKVQQMAAYGLGLIECLGSKNLLEKIRVVQSDSLSLIQGGFTAGSTTSESSCEAVRLCCDMLVDRLRPLKDSLIQKTGSVDWEMLILQAYFHSVNLSASTLFKPEFSSMEYLNYGAAVSEVEVCLLTGETKILQSDIVYDSGKSLNPAVDLGQIEGAFVQGIGFFMMEEYTMNEDGLIIEDGTWNYKIPTLDTIPKQFNVEILNSGHHKNRVLSSKASGEPPLLLAASVHCATRSAIREARKQLFSWTKHGFDSSFELPVPATMPVVKELCGLNSVESYFEWKMHGN